MRFPVAAPTAVYSTLQVEVGNDFCRVARVVCHFVFFLSVFTPTCLLDGLGTVTWYLVYFGCADGDLSVSLAVKKSFWFRL